MPILLEFKSESIRKWQSRHFNCEIHVTDKICQLITISKIQALTRAFHFLMAALQCMRRLSRSFNLWVRGRKGRPKRNDQHQRFSKVKVKGVISIKDTESESERCKTAWIRLWRALAMWGQQVKGNAPPSIGLNVKTCARRNLGQVWPPPVIGNSVYGPASPYYCVLSTAFCFDYDPRIARSSPDINWWGPIC